MSQNKFLRYCPNCNNYNESSGVCCYIHENVFQYPQKFIEYCDGKYLSLIKGKEIDSVTECKTDSYHNDETENEIVEDHRTLVQVFNSTDNISFLMAKSFLKQEGIKFWSNGEFIPPNIIIQSSYPYKIKVFEEDENAAQKILTESNTSLNQVSASSESGEKEQAFLVRWGMFIIAFIFIAVVIILLILKK